MSLSSHRRGRGGRKRGKRGAGRSPCNRRMTINGSGHRWFMMKLLCYTSNTKAEGRKVIVSVRCPRQVCRQSSLIKPIHTTAVVVSTCPSFFQCIRSSSCLHTTRKVCPGFSISWSSAHASSAADIADVTCLAAHSVEVIGRAGLQPGWER